MFNDYNEIKKLIREDVENSDKTLEDKFFEYCKDVSKEEKYAYLTDRSQNIYLCEGYQKWAEPVACLSLLAKTADYASIKDCLNQANLNTKDVSDMFWCFIACHRYDIKRDGSTEKEDFIRTFEIFQEVLLSRNDCTEACLKSLNKATLYDIATGTTNPQCNPSMSGPHPAVAPFITSLLIKTHFHLVKDGLLNGDNYSKYIDFILTAKEDLTYSEGGSGVKDFTPLYFLRDSYYEELGTPLVKNQHAFNKFLEAWMVSCVKPNRDLAGRNAFKDGTYDNLPLNEQYYAYRHLVELCLENKNYIGLGQLLCLKMTHYIPVQIKEIDIPKDVFDKIPWKTSFKKVKQMLEKSKRIFHYDGLTFHHVLNGQAFPYLLKKSIETFQTENLLKEKNSYATFGGINFHFESLTKYMAWSTNTQKQLSTITVITTSETARDNDLLENILRFTLTEKDKSQIIKHIISIHEDEVALNKQKEKSKIPISRETNFQNLLSIVFNSFTDKDIAREWLEEVKTVQNNFDKTDKNQGVLLNDDDIHRLEVTLISKKKSEELKTAGKKTRKSLTL